MIKNTFWQKFNLKTEKNYNPENDKKNLMNLVRPLSLKRIKNLRYGKLQIFIDDIISNKKINNLLFEENAKKEIAFFFRQQNAVLKNMNYLKSYKPKKKKESLSEMAEIFLKKKNDLVFKTIKNDIDKFKINKEKEIKTHRLKYLKFNCKNKENLYEISTKLFFKPVNDIRYSSYQKSLKNCFEKCKSDPNFDLPDLSLDINDAFSRLYHNVIFSPIKIKYKFSKNKSIVNKNIKNLKKKLSLLNSLENTNTKKKRKSIPLKEILTDDIELKEKYKKKFNLKEYFKEFKGKEFLISQSLSSRNICWKKSSGGPGVKSELPGKVILNKFNRNKTLEKEFIKDVNDYRDDDMNTNLHIAVKNNIEKFVKYFLDKNYNPNEQNKFGDTPLHYAIKLKNKNIIQLLLNDEGDLNIKNKKGITPYDLADRDLRYSFKI